jgi:hypothetical protein
MVNRRSRFPSGMTDRKARAKARAKQIPFRNDRQKSKGKSTADSLRE